jgi:Flp pilus assembly protein TadG
MQHKPLWKRSLFPTLRRGEDGQQMVEFAFTCVIFTMTLIAFVMFAVVFFMQASITHAAQQGSRHLYAHPLEPGDKDRFETADAEARWVITNSAPFIDWRLMTVEFSPMADRYSGGYVAVDVYFDVPLPTIAVPYTFTGDELVLMPPIQLHTRSRRALN